jgi:N-acetylglucosaminyl-diphospho-decaprenol L-rhamnosyltransferase
MTNGTNGNSKAGSTGKGTVGVVIPAHRGGTALLEAIGSLVAGELMPDWIVVVDNARDDDSVDRAVAAFPAIETVRNGRNLGFGRACNQGIERLRARGAEFIFLLNQDATVDPGTLQSLRSLARSHPRAAAIGPKTISSVAFEGERPILLYNGSWRTALPLWQRVPGVDRVEHSSDLQPVEVDFAWGHAMLLRGPALDEVGTFDPAFFMYYEDLDLCDRLRSAGWQIWCDRRAIARHAIADPSRAERSELQRWRWKRESGRHYCRKRWSWPLADALWLASTGRELASLCRRRKWTAAVQLVRAMAGDRPARMRCETR